jgi:hypothetical protein
MKLSDIQEGTIITDEIEKSLESKKTSEDITTPVRKIQKSDVSVEREKVKELAKTTTFKITPAMKVWVNTAIDLVTDNVSMISSACNISRTAWYHWTTTYPDFMDWFLEQYKGGRKRWLPRLDSMGMDRARKSFDYWKAMNQKAGDLLDGEHVGITGQNVVSILGGVTINNIGKEDKKDEEATIIGQETDKT